MPRLAAPHNTSWIMRGNWRTGTSGHRPRRETAITGDPVVPPLLASRQPDDLLHVRSLVGGEAERVPVQRPLEDGAGARDDGRPLPGFRGQCLVRRSSARMTATGSPQMSAQARRWARMSTMDHSPVAGAVNRSAAGTREAAPAIRPGASRSSARISSRVRCGSRALRERRPPTGTGLAVVGHSRARRVIDRVLGGSGPVSIDEERPGCLARAPVQFTGRSGRAMSAGPGSGARNRYPRRRSVWI